MMKKLKELSPFAIFGLGFAVVTMIFAIFAFFNVENLLLRIYALTSLCLTGLLNGINLIVYQKEKKTGYLAICAAVLSLYLIIRYLTPR